MKRIILLLGGAMIAPTFVYASVSAGVYAGVSAGDGSDNDNPKDVIVVTATARPEKANEVAESVDVIKGDELRERYINDISDALDDRVGVQQTGIGLDRKGISIRGMDVGHTLYLVDGQRINTSSGSIAHSDADLNWIPVDAIEQIEVVRGALSSLYGSEALGGVINVITREPTKEWYKSVNVQTLTNEDDLGGNQYKIGTYISGPLIEDKLGINFWADYRKRDILKSAFDPKLANQDQQHNSKVHLGLLWKPIDRQSIEFGADYGLEKRKDLRGSTNSYYTASDEISRNRLSLKHNADWGWGQSIIQAYQAKLHRDSERSDNGEITTPQELTDRILSGQLQFKTGAHSWVLGSEYRYEGLRDPAVNARHKDSLNHYAAFIQDQWKLNDKIKIGLGVRGDNHEDYGWQYSPKINAIYEINQTITIRGGVGEGFKAPSIKQLSPDYESYAAMGGRGIIRGNANLKPETSVNYELGFAYSKSDFDTSLTWFQNDIDDLIETKRQPTCNVKGKVCLNYINVAQAQTKGFEWGGNYKINSNLKIEANYTYLEAKDKTTNILLEDRSKHQFNTNIVWQANEKLQLKLRQQYRSKQYQGTSSPYAPSYNIWHIYANYKIKDVILNAGIENISDNKLGNDKDGLYTFSDAGRRYMLGLNVSF